MGRVALLVVPAQEVWTGSFREKSEQMPPFQLVAPHKEHVSAPSSHELVQLCESGIQSSQCTYVITTVEYARAAKLSHSEAASRHPDYLSGRQLSNRKSAGSEIATLHLCRRPES